MQIARQEDGEAPNQGRAYVYTVNGMKGTVLDGQPVELPVGRSYDGRSQGNQAKDDTCEGKNLRNPVKTKVSFVRECVEDKQYRKRD